MKSALPLAACLILAMCGPAAAQFAGWQHSGSVYLLTAPEGADLPASASVVDFPVLVRLHRDFFDFSQTQTHGEDLRFSSSSGEALAYQIEEWDAAAGTATIWLRVPLIRGNSQQEIRLHWGRPDAVNQSKGSAVFNASNGYLSVWHMHDPVQDEVGTLPSQDTGTTTTAGMVGPARHLAGNQGIFCGERILGLPGGRRSSQFRSLVPGREIERHDLGLGKRRGRPR